LPENSGYDEDKTNLFRLVELTQALRDKRILIRAQTKEMADQQCEIAMAESRLTMILDQLPTGMMITCNRVITYANNRMQDLTGYTKQELVGQSTRIFYDNDEDWIAVGKLQVDCDDVETPLKLKKKDGEYSQFVVRMTRIVRGSRDGDSEFVITLYLEKNGNNCPPSE